VNEELDDSQRVCVLLRRGTVAQQASAAGLLWQLLLPLPGCAAAPSVAGTAGCSDGGTTSKQMATVMEAMQVRSWIEANVERSGLCEGGTPLRLLLPLLVQVPCEGHARA
jgi:hypothetical protein